MAGSPARSVVGRLRALEDAAVRDTFLVAVQTVPVTVGKDWVQLDGFVLGPYGFDIARGPTLRISEAADGIDLISAGRHSLVLNCQLTNPTGDGWFESAVQPTDPTVANWPSDIQKGHAGRWIPAAVAGWEDVDLGAVLSYISPPLDAGMKATGHARYASASGAETVDVEAILYVTPVTI